MKYATKIQSKAIKPHNSNLSPSFRHERLNVKYNIKVLIKKLPVTKYSSILSIAKEINNTHDNKRLNDQTERPILLLNV